MHGPIRRRYQQDPVDRQRAYELVQGSARVVEMLEDVEADDQIERAVVVRESANVGDIEPYGSRHPRADRVQHVLGDIDTYHLEGTSVHEHLGPVRGSAPCVENTSPTRQLGGPSVPSQMLGLDQPLRHLRDEALRDPVFETRQLGHDQWDARSATSHALGGTGDNPTR